MLPWPHLENIVFVAEFYEGNAIRITGSCVVLRLPEDDPRYFDVFVNYNKCGTAVFTSTLYPMDYAPEASSRTPSLASSKPPLKQTTK